MNHKKKRRPIRQGSGRNSVKAFRSFATSRARRLKKRNRRYRKPNFWHQQDDRTYSKIVLRDVERMWLEQHASMAKVTYEKVHNCESMPLYKSGEWDGMAYFVRFAQENLHDAIMFRITWWNNRA